MELPEIPEAFQSRLRLRIVSALIMGKKSFSELKDVTNATDGNLSVQLSKLEAWGYVSVEKLFVNRKPLTLCTLTDVGRKAFREYVEMLNAVLEYPSED